jgi:hypothetical protein
MTNRIFATLKSRLPDGARAESQQAIDAIASAVDGVKTASARIGADDRFTDVGKREALAELRKAALTDGPLANLRSTYARKLENLRGEQAMMRRTALNGPDSADIGVTVRKELRDGEMRAFLRGLPLGDRLKAIADPEVARAVAGSAPVLSGIPPEVHANLVSDLTDSAIADKFGERAKQIAADVGEVEAVAAAIEVGVGLVEREGIAVS